MIPVLRIGNAEIFGNSCWTQFMSTTIDATGYNCPIPVLKARKAIKVAEIGDEILVLASDPASTIDIPHFCNTAGHDLVEQSESDGVFSYLIRKGV